MRKGRHRRKQARAAVSSNWYRSSRPNYPSYWSTAWEDWSLTDFWLDRAPDGKLKIDKLFKETWKLPGTIEPLIYISDAPGNFFFFVAAGQYYHYADGELNVHDGSMEFGNADEFLQYILLGARGLEGVSRLPDVEVLREPGMWWWDYAY
ncbi:hypothetical protein C8R45DRAFT_946612 [Mycena sanguinolenta]|nr:hypothetical protein C8R45DRAFT_946612 [Mycena sanguinolenta]